MKKTIAMVAALSVVILAGCTRNSDNNPGFPEGPRTTPSTAPPVTNPATNEPKPTENSTKTNEPEPTTPKPDKTTDKPEPKPSATVSSDAGTPANQFATRWGVRYPSVPEYAILKAANGVCAVINTFDNWESSALARKGIDEVVTAAGMQQNDAFEFAQDADQNYCASVSNPT